MKRSAQLKCFTICSLICRSAAELRRLKAAVGNLCGGGSMKDHGNNETATGWTIGVSVLKGRLAMALLPPACERWWWKTLCPGVDTHKSPHSALFSKTGGRRGGCVLFGHRASRAQPQQLQRWRVERCICEWCEVVIGGLIEPSAGSRRLWDP